MKKLIIACLFLVLLNSDLVAQSKIPKWDMFEITLKGPSKGNPFIGTTLTARFTNGNNVIDQEGFYDGNGTYIIRFMPTEEGIWNYVTSSNKNELSGKKGSLECIKPASNNHGPVRVSNKYHFKYEDGTPYYPFGTTIYEWPFQDENTKQQTIDYLKTSPFNKARFLAVPPYKDRYIDGPNKLTLFPFEGNNKDNWDFSKFNPEYFKNLDACVLQLKNLGIEADIILFRPYDKGKWGFDTAGQEVNRQFARYMVARYAAFSNIWWSLANENSFIKNMSDEDWDDLFKLVQEKDPYHHLRSIHNADRIYDYTKPWVTHVSYQYYNVVKSPIGTSILRDIYNKPIVNDEINYEGDIDSRWGQLTGEEMTFRFWNAVIGGGYATHGESYKTSPWISYGGRLTGSSPSRIEFLRKLIENNPIGYLEPIDHFYENNMLGKEGEYYLIYFGKDKLKKWDFVLPKRGLARGVKFKVDIIDTWNMTITPLNKTFEIIPMPENNYKFTDKDNSSIKLPSKQFMALRIYKVSDGGKVENDGKNELE
ncbi:DUF5060 domain-containing protein [Mariniflexile litorale]|uniref:DUF5060 domain-containing protein n=1 Tax=Mariniflexile litorale TaxID=3045158 RepID=A0AAU7EFX2_9FLAO|nr:DUF5060 domain-containing protein [Mariniflexile sp. KMM 9835]MDQ8211741.1 DUF5605 domain-containing protein [Mariniflexile sp. KMM 9835]